MAKPSRDMLTTGLVGSYLLASAWGILLLGAVVVLVAGTQSLDAAMGATFAGFAVVAGLLWLGGAICEAVGWIGLARLYPGLAAGIGWLEGSLPVLTLIIFAISVSVLDFSEGTLHFLAIMQILHFGGALGWMLTHGPRGTTTPAAVGYGIALAGGITLYLLALTGTNPELLGLVLFVAFLAGGTAAHLATGLFFGRSRALADSVNTF